MEIYKNRGGDSGISAYEIGDEYIRVQFSDGSIYLYTYSSAGNSTIEEMKRLAEYGEGLNAYINTTVRTNYASKER